MSIHPFLPHDEQRVELAPDGSEVRVLLSTPTASTAHFTLVPGAVSKATKHKTITEIWFIISGSGRIWRQSEAGEDVVELTPGASMMIPVGTAFQFRADPHAPLTILGTTMPPWPGDDEALPAEGPWEASV